MFEDKSVIDILKDFVIGFSWWDKVFLFLYVIVFGCIGLLMSHGFIEYANTISELLSNSNSQYTIYFSTFLCISAVNFILIMTLLFSPYSAKMIIKNLKYQYDYFEWNRPIGSALSFIIMIAVNLLLFPMFKPIYGLIFVFCLAASYHSSK